nr:hypothetical protein [Candidatus Sigynarchaeota archaeon]
MARPDYQKPIKICLLGAKKVGKKAFAFRFAKGYYNLDSVLEFTPVLKKIEIGNRHLQIVMVITPSEQESLMHQFARGSDIIIIIYDTTSRASFDTIRPIYQEILPRLPAKPQARFVLLGNKSDLKQARQVGRDAAESLAKELGNIPFFEVSCLTGNNYDGVMDFISSICSQTSTARSK